MIEIPTISVDEQELGLERKLVERTQNVLLTSEETKGYKENRAVILGACKDGFEGFKFFCDNFGWIQNPQAQRSEDKDIPFLLYNFQEISAREIIKAVMEGYDLPIEKSRKMGMSWLAVAIIVWGWHFQRWDSLLGSQTGDKVDKKGDMDSLFEKARYFIQKLPDWMIEPLKDKITDKNKLLIHPAHRSRISGETNNPNFGRAGRHKLVLFDEFSSWLITDKAAWQSCGSTANCRIPLSTPNTRGVNCFYYKVVQDAKKKDKPYLRLHWTKSPVFAKDNYIDDMGDIRSPWYDEQCRRSVSISEVHQELDIDYEASMAGKVFPDFKIEQIEEGIEYDPDSPLYVGWDWGLDTTAMIWFQPDTDGTIYIIDEYQNDGKGAGSDIMHYIDVIEAKGYKSAIHFGDPYSGENRSLAARGNSNAGIMRKYGLVVKTERAKKESRIAAGRNLLPRIVISSKCPIAIEMFSSWQLHATSGVPKHDEHSHIGDAYTYFCFNYQINKRNTEARPRRNYQLTSGGSIL